MSTGPDEVDVRRQAGWLPEGQDDLESWLAGHRERVQARGEQVVLHPVLVFRPGAIAEFSLAGIPQPPDPHASLVLVRSRLATANATA